MCEKSGLGATNTETVSATIEYYNFPLALLVGSETASMAEAFAAAVKTNRRGLLIGERTFGKGAGQSCSPIFDEGRLCLVDTLYFYPGTANENLRKNSQGDDGETQAAKPDPYLTELESVARGDALAGFVLFEVLHRRYGVSLECLDDGHLNALRLYLAKFVFERISKQGGS